jgi:large subunit ribosomal protein L32
MGALPKRKISKGRRGRRRQHDQLQPVTLVACSNCGAMKRPHSVCPECGYYKGREIVEIEE